MTNPVTNLTGGEFLVSYAAAIAATIAICHWMARLIDPTTVDLDVVVPSDVDPDEIAYLRGGKEELTRAVVARLVVQGFLRVEGAKEESRVLRAPAPPSADTLSVLEKRVYRWFTEPRSAEEIFEEGGLATLVGIEAARLYDEKLGAAGMLLPEEVCQRTNKIAIAGSVVIATLGFSRVVVGLGRNRPVLFLVSMGLIGIVVLWSLCHGDRRSSRGRRYLAHAKAVFEMQKAWLPVTTLVAVLGIAALAGTAYASLGEVFKKGSDGSAASCGGGCGGGGCGGCGGCG